MSFMCRCAMQARRSPLDPSLRNALRRRHGLRPSLSFVRDSCRKTHHRGIGYTGCIEDSGDAASNRAAPFGYLKTISRPTSRPCCRLVPLYLAVTLRQLIRLTQFRTGAPARMKFAHPVSRSGGGQECRSCWRVHAGPIGAESGIQRRLYVDGIDGG